MMKGKYGVAKSFRESVRDMDKQHELMERDTDVRTVDAMKRQLVTAEAEYNAEPNEPGKINKYVDVLRKTESMEHENRAIEILEDAFKRTSQFRFRRTAGEIKLRQLARMEQGMVLELRKNPADEELKKQIQQFRGERMEEELKEYTLWAENYPTETIYRYSMAQRMFALDRFDEAIPIFQNVRQDPKYKSEAGVLLGRAFMEAGFMDEAVDTLREVTEAYPIKGDEKSIEMTYYYARSLEAKREIELAKRAYSQVAQWNFGYRDVQARIKALRTPPKV
jgi:tetratricopeptide (TPR) repeat protein